LKLRTKLTDLAQDEQVRVEDLEKLLDNQLSQQNQTIGFLAGIVFGGILSVAVTKGIQVATIFNILTDPILAMFFIGIAAIGVALGTSFALSATSLVGFRYKIELMKDYLEARDLVEKRERKRPPTFE